MKKLSPQEQRAASKSLTAYYKEVFSRVEPYLKKGKTLLDVGCGQGEYATIFTSTYGLQVTGIDPQEMEGAKQKAHMTFVKGSAEALPFPDNSFDIVFSKDVLHHIDEPRLDPQRITQAMEEMRRVCAPHGTIIILEPIRYNPIMYFHMVKIEKHQHFTYRQLRNLITTVFPKTSITAYEAHCYPLLGLPFWLFYNICMNIFAPFSLRSYLLSVTTNDKQ